MVVFKLGRCVALLSAALVFTSGSLNGNPDPEALFREAERLFRLDNWIQARPKYHEAETLFAQQGNHKKELLSKFSRLRADAESRLSYPEVSRILAKDLQHPLLQTDPELRLRALIVKATADLSLDPRLSGREWNEALALAKKLEDRFWEGRAICELSIIAFLSGDTTKSVELNRTAGDIAQSIGDHAGLARQLSLLGVGLVEQESWVKASLALDQAIAIAEAHPEIRFPLMAYMGKSKVFEAQGKTGEADALIRKAQAFVEQVNMLVYKADLLLALAGRARKEAKSAEAIRLYEQAAAAAKAAGMPRPFAAAQFSLADLAVSRKDLLAARNHIALGLASSRKLVDMYVFPGHLAAAARIEQQLGNEIKAAAYYEEATSLIESMLIRVPSARIKAALVATMSEIFVSHFQLTLLDRKDLAGAFRILERARGRVIADQLQAHQSTPIDLAVAPTAAELELAQIQRALMTTTNASERQQLIHRLHLAERAIEPAEFARDQAAGLTTKGQPISLLRLQSLLQPDEAVLEYVLSRQRSFCVMVTAKTAQYYELHDQGGINRLIDAYWASVQKPATSSSDPVFRTLHEAVLQPVKMHNQFRHLIVIGDGRLSTVPFDSLMNQRGKLLLESHAVSYAPSATAFALQRSHRRGREKMLPLLAVATAANTESPTEDQNRRPRRAVFDLHASNFGPLPYAETEAQSVAQAIGKADQALLLGQDATEGNVKKQKLGRYRIVHFATHAFIDHNVPDRSAVLLTAKPAEPDDGLLQAREIRHLRLGAELVTLSACNTAVGRIEGQNGMASLVNSFLFAGARSVAASLWTADDTFTASLMTRFYEHLATGSEKATALQKAKLQMIERFGENARPFYWASFILVGDGRGKVQ